MGLKTICSNCKYNQGKEEYEENKFGIFCSNPEIQDYVDLIVSSCNLKEENKTMNTKQVIVVRHDLIKGEHAVRRGKMMAQVAHASIASLLKFFTIRKSETIGGGFLEPGQISYEYNLAFGPGTVLDDWLNGKFTKVVVSVPSETELLELYDKLCKTDKLIPFALITDAGLTEFKGTPTNTCLGIGPFISEEIDKYTGNLPLL